jgi:hypothetical protein
MPVFLPAPAIATKSPENRPFSRRYSIGTAIAIDTPGSLRRLMVLSYEATSVAPEKGASARRVADT